MLDLKNGNDNLKGKNINAMQNNNIKVYKWAS